MMKDREKCMLKKRSPRVFQRHPFALKHIHRHNTDTLLQERKMLELSHSPGEKVSTVCKDQMSGIVTVRLQVSIQRCSHERSRT